MLKLYRKIDSLELSSLYCFFILFIFTFSLFYPALIHPYLDSDELIWGEVSNNMVEACPPYLCVIGEKPPLLYYYFASIFKIFGSNQYFWAHFFHLFIISINAFLMSRFLMGGIKKKHLLIGLFYILMQALPGFQMRSVTGESLMNPFLISAWICLLKYSENKNKYFIFFAGLLTALASAFRHQAGMGLAFAGFFFLLINISETKKILPTLIRTLWQTLILILGFSSIWLVIILHLKKLGVLNDYLFWGFKFELGYIHSGQHSAGMKLAAFLNIFALFVSTFLFWFLSSFAFQKTRVEKNENRYLLSSAAIYLICSLIATAPGTRFYRHYFIQAFPPLALLAYLGLKRLLFVENKFKKFISITSIATLVLAYSQNFFMKQTFALSVDRDYEFSLFEKVGTYLKNHSQAKDKIQVWGWSEAIYLYADRRIGSRFIHSDFLTGRVSAANPASYTWQEAQKNVFPGLWKTFFEDLEKNKPLYFVDSSPSQVHRYQYFAVENYPELKKYLDDHYFLETSIEGMKIYRRLNEFHP